MTHQQQISRMVRYGMHVVHSGLMLPNLITLAPRSSATQIRKSSLYRFPASPDTTAMACDNRMADGKANSHTTLFGRKHRAENMIVIGWIDARASILDGHVNKILFVNTGSYAQYSRRCRLHRLNGVHDQV